MIIYACIMTHHLLPHKPDNLLQTGHKYQLCGYYKFGTPGVAVCWTHDAVHLDNFVLTLSDAMPQKKFQILWQQEWTCDTILPVQGWNRIESGSELQQALGAIDGVSDDDYFIMLGLDPTKAASASATAPTKTKKKNGGKKKKR